MKFIQMDNIKNVEYPFLPNNIKIYDSIGEYKIDEAIVVNYKYIYQIIALEEQPGRIVYRLELAGRYDRDKKYKDLNISLTIDGKKIAEAIRLKKIN